MAHKLPPPITRDERGVAREIRAMADDGLTTSEILKRWPQFDAHFVERVLSDPTIKDEVREARARGKRTRKRIRKIEKLARGNPPSLPVERQALPRARVTLCEAVTWLATGKACSGKVLRQMPLSEDVLEDVQTGQKIELAGRHLWDAFVENDLPMFGHRVNDYGKPSVEIEQIPSEKSLSRRTTTAPLMGLVDDTISVGATTYEGVTMRRSDLLRLWPASTSPKGRGHRKKSGTKPETLETWEAHHDEVARWQKILGDNSSLRDAAEKAALDLGALWTTVLRNRRRHLASVRQSGKTAK